MSHGVSGPGRSSFALLGLVLAGSIVLAGCQSNSDSASTSRTGAGRQSAAPAVLIEPADGTAKVALGSVVTVKASEGKLSTVGVRTAAGRTLKGSLSPDGRTWTSSAELAAATTYRVAVRTTAGTKTSSFTTLTPKGSVTASILPSSGMDVGVGMPVIVTLSRGVSTKDRPGVENALKVSTPAKLTGAWRWFSSTQLQWRPAKYWPAHSTVSVTADLAGVPIQPGIWGSTEKRSSHYSVGSAMISTVNVAGHTMTVRRDGKVLRVIPVTTGKADMATRNGIKVIMSRQTSHRMDSTSIGITKNDPGYYNLVVKYAMRLTYSGEFLHAAPWSAGSQGRVNVSHGCTGMSTAAAKWLYNRSKLGDIVIYKNSTRKLEWGNGYTAWNLPFSKWKSV